MNVKQVTPSEAKKALDGDGGAIYLDVRTEEEFAAGHAAGAINIPVAVIDPDTGAMRPNTDFLQVAGQVLPKSKSIFCGCKSGGRSQRAAEMLAGAGYTGVSNVRGGFSGQVDPSGRVVVKGWAAEGLPVSTDTSDAVSYQGVCKRASHAGR
jgi:rhodanese-related sulfurtransferase